MPRSIRPAPPVGTTIASVVLPVSGGGSSSMKAAKPRHQPSAANPISRTIIAGAPSQDAPQRGYDRHPRDDGREQDEADRQQDQQRPVADSQRDAAKQLRSQRRDARGEEQQHGERSDAARHPADRRIERETALEQPRDLHVGGAEHVHHLDRRAMRLQPCAGREDDDRAGSCRPATSSAGAGLSAPSR
ncbi:hypothetical protein WR25_17371 [Diploscapter pachys]|uniref:Uncharacterized protein n=1 Tax=Diploscapter pachys TaxID=2018661 RepID=A0A2A2M3P6_9BILA|nr:hypothetical protein WR25_17371 [Diploscapter pachys]